jgi:vesicle-fusing ATPase
MQVSRNSVESIWRSRTFSFWNGISQKKIFNFYIRTVFRRRSAGEDSGEQTRASVVNQILSKLDGVNSIDNVLLIGMTNRRELLDEALLRPGRLEVQIEVPLPDKEGRREILQIHFNILRSKGRLSKPLCCAIDGVPLHSSKTNDVQTTTDISYSDDDNETEKRKRDMFKRGMSKLVSSVRPYYDLAEETRGFSGADIAGLVRSVRCYHVIFLDASFFILFSNHILYFHICRLDRSPCQEREKKVEGLKIC